MADKKDQAAEKNVTAEGDATPGLHVKSEFETEHDTKGTVLTYRGQEEVGNIISWQEIEVDDPSVKGGKRTELIAVSLPSGHKTNEKVTVTDRKIASLMKSTGLYDSKE